MLIDIILIFAVLLVLFVIAMIYENKSLMTTEYEVCSTRLPKEADGTNFVVIADLHNNQFGQKNSDLIQKIDELAPDFIIVAGDLFIGREYNFDIAYEFLLRLAAKYTVYYSFGNHEQKVEEYEAKQLDIHWNVVKRNRKGSRRDTRQIKTFAQYTRMVRHLGVHILNNEAMIRPVGGEKNLRIFGGTIDLEYFKRFHRPPMNCNYLNSCFGEGMQKDYQILIAHNPMYFETYAEWGADLVLSGHVHGGMVRIPFLGGVISPQMEIFPKYDAGMFTTKVSGHTATMIVSRGLGIHTLKIRLFNRPELVHVTLKKN